MGLFRFRHCGEQARPRQTHSRSWDSSGHPPYNGGFLPESVIHVTPDYVTQKGDTRSIAWYGGLTNNHENHGMGKSRTFERWLVTGAVVTAFVFMAAVAAESDHERSVFGGYVLALFR